MSEVTRYGRVLPVDRDYCVHVMSRVVDRSFRLGDVEKEFFRRLMWKMAKFCGLKIITYAILDNHFHILIKVPKHKALSEDELLHRLEDLHGSLYVAEVKQRLERFKGFATSDAYDAEIAKHVGRMYDLGQYMKALKQQFTCWYNGNNNRKGTLWEARYKSVVVQGTRKPLLTMATYIDLNPVRAGICEDPKEYRWCGYAEAMGGNQDARDGMTYLSEVEGHSTAWTQVRRVYRQWLACYGLECGRTADGSVARKGFKRDDAVQIWDNGGELAKEDYLRCRVRYFTDGVAIGSRAYLEDLFSDFKERFGSKRKTGARRMRGLTGDVLYSLRDLRVDVVS